MYKKAFANYSTMSGARRDGTQQGAMPSDDSLIEDRVRSGIADKLLHLAESLSETAKKYPDPQIRQGFEECLSLLMIESSKIRKGEDTEGGDSVKENTESGESGPRRGAYKSAVMHYGRR